MEGKGQGKPERFKYLLCALQKVERQYRRGFVTLGLEGAIYWVVVL